MATKAKKPPLALVVWANIGKWMLLRGVGEDELAAVLGIKRLEYRNKSLTITADEMERISDYLAIEPEKLLER